MEKPNNSGRNRMRWYGRLRVRDCRDVSRGSPLWQGTPNIGLRIVPFIAAMDIHSVSCLRFGTRIILRIIM